MHAAFTAAALSLLLLACATPGRELAGPRPSSVVVLVVTSAPDPAAQGLLDLLAGVEPPGELLARESVRALRRRGYEAATLRPASGGGESREAAQAAAQASGAGAALLVTLGRLDLRNLRPLGTASIELRTELIAADGTLLFRGIHDGVTSPPGYKAQQDFRAHLRDALERALQELP